MTKPFEATRTGKTRRITSDVGVSSPSHQATGASASFRSQPAVPARPAHCNPTRLSHSVNPPPNSITLRGRAAGGLFDMLPKSGTLKAEIVGEFVNARSNFTISVTDLKGG